MNLTIQRVGLSKIRGAYRSRRATVSSVTATSNTATMVSQEYQDQKNDTNGSTGQIESAIPDSGDAGSQQRQRGEPVPKLQTSGMIPSRRAEDSKMSKKPRGRRLIVGCDGTWVNSEAGSKDNNISNITRLCRAFNVSATSTTNNKEQIVFYHRGIGTDGNKEDKYLSAGLGSDLGEHTRECYGFLTSNYRDYGAYAESQGMSAQQVEESAFSAFEHGEDNADEDEIFIFGFSRGAYTARVISAMISDVGILNAQGMEFFHEVWYDWKNQNVIRASSPAGVDPAAADGAQIWQQRDAHGKIAGGIFAGWDKKPRMPSFEYRDALWKMGYLHTPTPTVRLVGVFDTVGHLGVPPILGFQWEPEALVEFSFVNTQVSSAVQYAVQAVCLDDHRAAFFPTMWVWPEFADSDVPGNERGRKPQLRGLKQTWFPGVHCSVGGSFYVDASLSDMALAWMISQIQSPPNNSPSTSFHASNPPQGQSNRPTGPLLDLDMDYLKWALTRHFSQAQAITHVQGSDGNASSKVDVDPGFRGWAMGRMLDTQTFLYEITGPRDAAKAIMHAGLGAVHGITHHQQKITDSITSVSTNNNGSILPDLTWEGIKKWINVGDRNRLAGRGVVLDASNGEISVLSRMHSSGTAGSNMTPHTEEHVHPSVRVRMARGGLGLNDVPKYEPRGLEGFAISGDENGSSKTDPLAAGYRWVGKGLGENGADVILPEDTLGEFERLLQGLCDKTPQTVLGGAKE